MTRVSTLELLAAEEGGEDEYAHLRPKPAHPAQSRVSPGWEAPSADAVATLLGKFVDSEVHQELLAHTRVRVLAARDQVDSAMRHVKACSSQRSSMLPTTLRAMTTPLPPLIGPARSSGSFNAALAAV